MCIIHCSLQSQTPVYVGFDFHDSSINKTNSVYKIRKKRMALYLSKENGNDDFVEYHLFHISNYHPKYVHYARLRNRCKAELFSLYHFKIHYHAKTSRYNTPEDKLVNHSYLVQMMGYRLDPGNYSFTMLNIIL